MDLQNINLARLLPLLIPVIILEFGLMVWALLDVICRPNPRGNRVVWIIVIVMVNLIGPLVYFMFGRSEGAEMQDEKTPGSVVEIPRPAPASTGPRPAAIKCQNLTKNYGDKTALDSLTLEVPECSIFGFLGPNGAGKTTTIKLLMGMSRPTTGRAWVNGEEVAADTPRMRAHIGYLPDVPNFYTWMTGAEFLYFVGELHHLSAADNKRRISEVLELADLKNASKLRIGGYSRGMKQRLGLAQALMNKPEVLFLDEPCSALDPMGRRDVLKLILRLKESTTIFMSTHILSDVERVCDGLAILKEGKLITTSTVSDLRERYAHSSFEIELDAPADALLQTLKVQPWVVKAEKAELNHYPGLRVLVSNVAQAQHELPRVISDSGLGLVRYELTMPSLEDIFVKLVGGDAKP
jgi:ABC-2 type transport system ATP-binding protein